MTAVELLTGLRAAGCRVEVKGPRLAVAGRVPPRLKPPLLILHTGLRALLGNRGWWACLHKGRNHGEGQPVRLNPAEPLPADAYLLHVEGAAGWDRISPAARLDAPEVFQPAREPARTAAGASTSGPTLAESRT